MDPDALWHQLSDSLTALHKYPDNPHIRAEVLDQLDVLARWLMCGGVPPTLQETCTQIGCLAPATTTRYSQSFCQDHAEELDQAIADLP